VAALAGSGGSDSDGIARCRIGAKRFTPARLPPKVTKHQNLAVNTYKTAQTQPFCMHHNVIYSLARTAITDKI